ncbi:hypothetical protein K431DRAFT_170804 [Polychaeton citri CBS 116435]|uniref:Fungal N-terminal domain-containing protein n=1 Tax=Polychaeton citri CBS 116435 TaxID=1314669 RepID=A0A9P4PZS6_9PEZI|nr:hypothetical protein K431DRAFT_170804 [Polychaeton citri CBS 116435]
MLSAYKLRQQLIRPREPMDPFTVLAAASAASTVVVNLTTTIADIVELCHRIKTANNTLLALVSQLNTMKSALDQVERLMGTVEHDYQLRIDLDIACQASMMQIRLLDEQIAKFKTKSNRISELRLASKIKVVTKSQGMEACLMRLDRQSNALNLLVTVLTSRSVTDQKQLLEKTNIHGIFHEIREDTATLNEQDERRSFTTVASKADTCMTTPSQVFAFDSECVTSRPYDRSFRGFFRRRTAKFEEAKRDVSRSEGR